MKVLEKFKKVFSSVILGAAMLPTKIFAFSRDEAEVYGPPEDFRSSPSVNNINTVGDTFKDAISFAINIAFKIFAFILIPAIFIVGSIIFFKKSKMETKYKILIIVGILILLISLYIIGFFIVNNL